MRLTDAELKKLLATSDKIKPEALTEAEKQHEQTNEPLLSVIIKRKLISEKELGKLYAKSIDVPFVELGDTKIPRDTLLKIPERISRKYQAVLFGIEEDKLQLAMADPEDFQATDFIEKQLGVKIKVYMATQADVLAAIDQYKGNIEGEITQAIRDSSAEEAEQQEVSAKDLTEDAPIAKTVNIILEYAIKSRASDVHIEPRENIVQVRYRVDGVLHETMTLPKPILAAVISRIKILSNLKIDEHRVPQDGRFKFAMGSKQVALRVSTLPIMDGEKVVMRILDESSKPPSLEDLGFAPEYLHSIDNSIHKPHGMILVTGPTGSGKSTTLFAVLNMLNTPGINISTVEDPVEYRVSGVNQTQVNTKAGMTFAGGLRALLRQDPNVIMVGEVRDGETADLAVQAALTGHLVLSTLHTNNAATCLPRLLDMGIEPFLIASTINCVVAQRLVRRLCDHCKISYIPDDVEIAELKKHFRLEDALKSVVSFLAGSTAPILAPVAAAPVAEKEVEKTEVKGRHKEKTLKPEHDLTGESILQKIASDPNIINRTAAEASRAKAPVPAVIAQNVTLAPSQTTSSPTSVDPKNLRSGQFLLYKPGTGCDVCGGTSGYIGRMGIHEVLENNEKISQMIIGHSTSDEIQQQAMKDGMNTMSQDGFVKALAGRTSVAEIMRVTRE